MAIIRLDDQVEQQIKRLVFRRRDRCDRPTAGKKKSGRPPPDYKNGPDALWGPFYVGRMSLLSRTSFPRAGLILLCLLAKKNLKKKKSAKIRGCSSMFAKHGAASTKIPPPWHFAQIGAGIITVAH